MRKTDSLLFFFILSQSKSTMFYTFRRWITEKVYLCTRKGINPFAATTLYPIAYNILFFNGFIPESI